MALKVGELYGVLKLDKSNFDQGISEGGLSFGKFSKLIIGGAAVAAAAVIGIGVAAGTMAIDFEKGMANVQTLLGKGSAAEARIAEFKDDIKRLSVETGTSLDGMTDGIYQVISAWGDTADTSKILEISAKSAKAGLATTTDAVNLLSLHTKGYGDTSAAAVQKAADLAFQTANLGQTTFPELAASMGKVIPLAATLKIKEEELYGAMATLTGVTGNTAEVSTQLQATMNALVKANPAMLKALKSQGYESGMAAIESLGLGGTLEMLTEATGGSTQKLAELLGSSTALNATLALTGNQAEDFAFKTAKMGEASGVATDAFDIQQKTVAATMDKVSAAFQVVLVNLGDKLLPMLLVALEWVMANMPTISAIFEAVFATISSAINWVVTNVVPPLIAIFTFIKDVVIPQVSAAFDSVSTDVLPALGGAFDFITEVVIPALADVFKWIMTNILPPLQSIFTTFTTVILPALSRAFQGVQQWIKENWPLISSIIGMVASAVKTAFNVIAEIIRVVSPIIIKIAEVVFPLVGGAAKFLLEVIKNVFGTIGTVWETAAKVADTITKSIGTAFDNLKKGIKAVWDGITGIIKGAINGIIGAVNGMIRALNGIQIHIPGVETPAGTIGKFDWNGLNLGQIPYLARGTKNFAGGWAMLGEEGPELARLPQGTQVFPAGQTADMLSGSGGASGGPLIGQQNIYGVQPGDVERETRRAFRRQALNWALEGR